MNERFFYYYVFIFINGNAFFFLFSLYLFSLYCFITFFHENSPGDYGSFTQLFLDNLSTTLGALFAVQNMANFAAPQNDIDKVVWDNILPGIGVTMFVGNL